MKCLFDYCTSMVGHQAGKLIAPSRLDDLSASQRQNHHNRLYTTLCTSKSLDQCWLEKDHQNNTAHQIVRFNCKCRDSEHPYVFHSHKQSHPGSITRLNNKISPSIHSGSSFYFGRYSVKVAYQSIPPIKHKKYFKMSKFVLLFVAIFVLVGVRQESLVQ